MQQTQPPCDQGDRALKSESKANTDLLPTIVYVPESRLRSPAQLFKEMWYDLLASRDLAWQLFRRDLSAQYRQSVLGIFWVFIPPLTTAIGLTLLQNARIINLGKTDIPYPLYVMFSMTLWQIFTDAISKSMGAVQAAKGMLSKIRVPPEAFVLAKLGQLFFTFSIQSILVIGLFIFFRVPVTWSILLTPVALLHLVMFGTGIGLLLGPVAALYGDVNRAMGFILRVWLLITPVVYALPEKGLWAILVKINPVTSLLVTTRELATTGTLTYPVGWLLSSALAFVIFALGWTFFRLAMPFIVERAAMS
jgi:lipopolysaccharide transport system permease protein